MEQYLIGKIIKEFRLRNNLSQEELTCNICAVSTLSRIENGRQIPNRKLVEALFSKMGMSAPLHTVPMSKTDLERWKLEYEITNSVLNRDYEIKTLLENYRTCSSELNIFEQQFYILYKVIYYIHHNGNPEKALFQLEKARQLTMKTYSSKKKIFQELLTETECLIIYAIAVVLYNMQHKKFAVSILLFLKTYCESHTISENQKEKDYAIILYTLSKWLYADKKYTEALEISETGIKVCVSYGLLPVFPYLLFNKGCCLLQLNKVESGKKIIKHAFTFMQELGKYNNVVLCAGNIKKSFGIHI